MSAYMLNDAKINNIVAGLTQRQNREDVRVRLWKAGYTDSKRLALRLFALNKWGVESRYGKNTATDFRPLDFVFVRTIAKENESTLEDLQNWLSQCSEGNIPENSRFYALMTEIEQELSAIVALEMQEKKRIEAKERAKLPPVRRIDIVDVAKLVRAKLKEKFPGQKFKVRSERYAGGSSIEVNWTDGPTTKEVRAICDHYQGSTFDGMIDLRSYHDSTCPDSGKKVHYSNDHIFCQRAYTENAMTAIWMNTQEKWGLDNSYATLTPNISGCSSYYKFSYEKLHGSRDDAGTLYNQMASETSFYIAPTKQEKKTEPKKEKSTEVTYGDFKGHATIGLPMPNGKMFNFGLNKAQAILDNLEALQQFIADNV